MRWSTHDYWGDLQVTTGPMTPVQILREQAMALNERDTSLIRASVATSALSATTQKFRSTLAITVSSLDRYRLDIVTVIYPLRDYYPLELSDDLANEYDKQSEVSCHREKEFREELRRILSSKRTTDTLKSLMLLTAEKVLSR